jgi:uncharacterized protein (TIGR02246 family)
MPKQWTFTLIALAVFLLCRGEPVAAQLTDADRKGIQDGTDRFTKAMLSGDAAGIAALYTEDGMLLPPNEGVVKGRAAIQQYVSRFPKITAFEPRMVYIEGNGEVAYTRGTYEITMMPPGAKTPSKASGKFIEIRKKQPDGSWLLARDFWNSYQAAGD